MKLLDNTRKGIAISGTIIATVLGIGLTTFFGLQLISALEVVANYVSLAGAFLLSAYVVYYGFEENYLDDFFTDEGLELLFLVIVATGIAPIAYLLFEGVISAVGGLVGGLVVGLVTLAIFFSPAYVFGGLASIVGFLADLIGIFGGEN